MFSHNNEGAKIPELCWVKQWEWTPDPDAEAPAPSKLRVESKEEKSSELFFHVWF